MPTITEPAREIPVVADCDVCVVGGSCTGVFAAVRAARLGARVAIIEKQNAFGGVATSGLVNVWHSMYNTIGTERIIAGLTQEVIDRLAMRNAVDGVSRTNASVGCRFNSEELKIELDELVTENRIRPFLHTHYCAPHCEGRNVRAVIVENKNGRSAISAKVFVDATGDGDIAAHLGLPHTLDDHLQPPTVCAKIRRLHVADFDLKGLVRQHREEFDLKEDYGWSGSIPNVPEISMCAETHVFNTNAADADQLTAAEIEGRRQIRALVDMIRKYGPQGETAALVDLCSYMGIRETRRFETEYRLTEQDVLTGREFDDAIAYGSYRVDVHHTTKGGFVFRYLDGTQLDMDFDGTRKSRWRDPIESDPTYYQVPYRTMVTHSVDNLILAGRMISTDKGAFGAVRVMVNLNQVGEAAGVAAALAGDTGKAVVDIDPAQLRRTLAAGGSAVASK